MPPSGVGHLVVRGALPKRIRHQKQGLDRFDVEAEALRRWKPGHPYWLTTSEAAVVLGVSVSRVKQLVAAGYLPYVRKGDRYLFRRPQAEVIGNARRLRWGGVPSGRERRPLARAPGLGRNCGCHCGCR